MLEAVQHDNLGPFISQGRIKKRTVAHAAANLDRQNIMIHRTGAIRMVNYNRNGPSVPVCTGSME